MKKKFVFLGAVKSAILLLTAETVCAQIINVPFAQPTIQAAINISKNGDVIQVSPGIYYENINFMGKAISVESVRNPRPAIIDGGAKGSVVTFSSGESVASILDGFIIQHGNADDGGGVFINGSSPTIVNNVIKKNAACSGAGITVSFSSPTIKANRIADNHQGGCSGGVGGGGISIRGAASAKIWDNIIENNSMDSADGGGIALFAAGKPSIKGNIIRGNSAGSQGGGINMYNQSDANIFQNLIIDNQAPEGSGIAWLVPSGDRGPVLINNTITNNPGTQVFADGFDVQSVLVNNIIVAETGQVALKCGDFNDNNPPFIRFNDIYGISGNAYTGICKNQTGIRGNISSDPLFVAKSLRNYHIGSASPVIDKGTHSTTLQPMDFDGAKRIQDGNLDGNAIVDMGVDEYTPKAAVLISLVSDVTEPKISNPLVSNGSRNLYTINAKNKATSSVYDAAGNLAFSIDENGVKH